MARYNAPDASKWGTFLVFVLPLAVVADSGRDHIFVWLAGGSCAMGESVNLQSPEPMEMEKRTSLVSSFGLFCTAVQ
jgi:hypothetical protein